MSFFRVERKSIAWREILQTERKVCQKNLTEDKHAEYNGKNKNQTIPLQTWHDISHSFFCFCDKNVLTDASLKEALFILTYTKARISQWQKLEEAVGHLAFSLMRQRIMWAMFSSFSVLFGLGPQPPQGWWWLLFGSSSKLISIIAHRHAQRSCNSSQVWLRAWLQGDSEPDKLTSTSNHPPGTHFNPIPQEEKEGQSEI